MTIPVAPRLFTAAEFLRYAGQDGLELVDGELKENPMGGISSFLGGKLYRAIDEAGHQGQAGFAFPQETGIAIWPENPRLVRKPDAMFFRREHMPNGVPAGWIIDVPDIVAEVVSPNDEAEYINRKLFDYRRAGIPLVWVIHPETRTAYVHRGERIEFIDTDGVLDGGDILPGFSLSLAELFGSLPAVE